MKLSGNIRNLYSYHIFTSLALSFISSTAILDRLMLKMEINVERFGVIKSAMFIAPALLYQLSLPLLQKWNSSERVCMWGYGLRMLLPCLLPFLAIGTDNQDVLAVAAMLILGLGGTLAAFANNSLLAIYRQYLPEKKFNYYAARMAICINLPASVMILGWVYFLDFFQKLDRTEYLMAFGVIQLVSILPEIGAIRAIRRLHDPAPLPAPKQFLYRDMLLPFQDGKYLRLLAYTFSRNIAGGLFITFFVVYLYLERNWSTFHVTVISSIFSLTGLIAANWFGKLVDRSGYQLSFRLLSLLFFFGNFACGFFLDSVWGLLLGLLLVWDGTQSIFSTLLNIVEQSAGSKLARKDKMIFYISAYNLSRMVGIFLGCLIAGPLLAIVSAGDHYNFPGFFRASLFFSVIPVLIAMSWRDQNKENKRS